MNYREKYPELGDLKALKESMEKAWAYNRMVDDIENLNRTIREFRRKYKEANNLMYVDDAIAAMTEGMPIGSVKMITDHMEINRHHKQEVDELVEVMEKDDSKAGSNANPYATENCWEENNPIEEEKIAGDEDPIEEEKIIGDEYKK